jgi:hypothetical protein
LKEEKIKSALEIAMEKISDLPELTREEIADQQEKEYGLIGDAAAQKYLDGVIGERDLLLVWDRFSGIQAQIVRRRLVDALCGEIRLDSKGGLAMKALEGLELLGSENKAAIAPLAENFREIVGRFTDEQKNGRRQFQISVMDEMRKVGISGSAVRPNMNEHPQWKTELRRIQDSYARELEDIRCRLTKEVQP